MKDDKHEVFATDEDTINDVDFLDCGAIDDEEYDADSSVVLSEGGHIATFRAVRRTGGDYGGLAYSVTVRLAFPAVTYADVFQTSWDTVDAELDYEGVPKREIGSDSKEYLANISTYCGIDGTESDPAKIIHGLYLYQAIRELECPDDAIDTDTAWTPYKRTDAWTDTMWEEFCGAVREVFGEEAGDVQDSIRD